MPDDDDDYEVGYGKPPKESRFRSGQSGNPKRRPAGSKNIKTLFLEIGNEKITVTENGRTKTMTKSEAAIRQLHNVSMKGDLRAMREVLRFHGIAEEAQANEPEHKVLEEKDRAAMKRMQARMQAMANKPEEKT